MWTRGTDPYTTLHMKSNTWTVETQSQFKRISVKRVRGVTVRRIEVFGCRSERANALGTPSRDRWTTRGFTTLDGEYHTNWNDVLGHIGDPVIRAKLDTLEPAQAAA